MAVGRESGISDNKLNNSFSNPILPNTWKGETNCIVGPFSGKNIAEYFANRVVDFGHYEMYSERIFAKRDAWFIEIQKIEVQNRVVSS